MGNFHPSHKEGQLAFTKHQIHLHNNYIKFYHLHFADTEKLTLPKCNLPRVIYLIKTEPEFESRLSGECHSTTVALNHYTTVPQRKL